MYICINGAVLLVFRTMRNAIVTTTRKQPQARSFRTFHKTPPTFAIANKFLIGQLPDHLRPRKLDVTDDPGTTQLEFDLIRPIYLGSGWILVVHPGRKAFRASDEIKDKNAQKALSGHWYCTELDTSEVAAKMGFQGQVPLALENVPLRAVLTGALTADCPLLKFAARK